MEPITVLLADDNLIVREGVRALLSRDADVEVVGVAGDYDELVARARELRPQVLVTDIRMPPTFQDEGIEGAKEVRKRLPATGVVVLSQYDSPEYALGLLADGAAGYAYLLKDRVADSGRLGRAIREVATGGSMLDPEIVRALRTDREAVGRTERLTVTVLMSDVRGYSAIAERSDPAVLANQLNAHRQAMNAAILAEEGTVMQYVGDAVIAVFGAPDLQRDHARRALRAALGMHARQDELNSRWAGQSRAPFGLGIGLSTGEVAAALLGSAERLEYTSSATW